MSAVPAPRSETTLAIALAEGCSSEEQIPRITATGRGAVASTLAFTPRVIAKYR
jgi:hypothetical protein